MSRFEHEGNAWEDGELVELSAKHDRSRGDHRGRMFTMSDHAMDRIKMMAGGNSREQTSCNLERVLIGLTPEMWREARRRYYEANANSVW